MEGTLITAQIIFYLTVSAAILIIGILLGVVVYHIVRIARTIDAISDNIRATSGAVRARVMHLLEDTAEMPFITFLIKRWRGKGRRE